MTDFIRSILYLNTGKQIKLFANSLAIWGSLEIGEGAAPTIFSYFEQQPQDDTTQKLLNELKYPQGNKTKAAKKIYCSRIQSLPVNLIRAARNC